MDRNDRSRMWRLNVVGGLHGFHHGNRLPLCYLIAGFYRDVDKFNGTGKGGIDGRQVLPERLQVLELLQEQSVQPEHRRHSLRSP